MPFSLDELVPMSLALRDACLGIVELAYPDSHFSFNEDYKSALQRTGVRMATHNTDHLQQEITWAYVFKVWCNFCISSLRIRAMTVAYFKNIIQYTCIIYYFQIVIYFKIDIWTMDWNEWSFCLQLISKTIWANLPKLITHINMHDLLDLVPCTLTTPYKSLKFLNDLRNQSSFLNLTGRCFFQITANLVNQLFARDARRQFCPRNHWLAKHIHIQADKVFVKCCFFIVFECHDSTGYQWWCTHMYWSFPWSY